MGVGKNIVYQYLHTVCPDDLEVDLTGELTFKTGDIIVRGGKHWRIDSITVEDTTQELRRPTLWIYLVEAAVN